MATDVAVCVPYRPRNPHDARLWNWCERWWRTHFPDWQVCVGDSGHVPFNRSASRNVAAAMAPDASCLLFANSDTVYAEPGHALTVVDIVRGGGWCLPWLYVETSSDYTEAALGSDPGDPLPDPLSSYDRQLPDSPAGPQVMSREAFEAVHGWDERFRAWGREDLAMVVALDVLHAAHTRAGVAVHLWHPRTNEDTFRARGYPENRALYLRTYGRAWQERDPDRQRRAMLAAIPTIG